MIFRFTTNLHQISCTLLLMESLYDFPMRAHCAGQERLRAQAHISSAFTFSDPMLGHTNIYNQFLNHYPTYNT